MYLLMSGLIKLFILIPKHYHILIFQIMLLGSSYAKIFDNGNELRKVEFAVYNAILILKRQWANKL